MGKMIKFNITKFMIYGWQINFTVFQWTRGIDSLGRYNSLRFPGHYVAIRDSWNWKSYK